MSYGYANSKPGLKNRLNRIEGQVRGVSKMVEDDKYCIDILTQISAVQNALDKVALELLKSHSRHCLALASKQDRIKKADELVATIGRLI